MQRYVFIHELTDDEFERLVVITTDHDSMQWLSAGAAGEWSRERMMELRDWSARDANMPTSGRRSYYFWAITIDGRVAGMVGIHPVPKGSFVQRARSERPASSRERYTRCRGQIMFVVAREYRGQGIAAQAARDIMPQYHACAIIRADNTVALRTMRKVQVAREIVPTDGRPMRIRARDYVIFEPTA
jgi:RimJ/RimL family protein N-acetyltransferase